MNKRYFCISLLILGSLLIVSCLKITNKETADAKYLQKAPPFKLVTIYGKIIDSNSIYKKNVVVINFWATWCPPCRAEIPDFVSVYNNYKDKRVKIIGISLDFQKKVVEDFLSHNKITYPVCLLGNSELDKKFGGIAYIPTTFIIDLNGKIQEKFVGAITGEELEAAIKKYLPKGR